MEMGENIPDGESISPLYGKNGHGLGAVIPIRDTLVEHGRVEAPEVFVFPDDRQIKGLAFESEHLHARACDKTAVIAKVLAMSIRCGYMIRA